MWDTIGAAFISGDGDRGGGDGGGDDASDGGRGGDGARHFPTDHYPTPYSRIKHVRTGLYRRHKTRSFCMRLRACAREANY